MEVYYLFIPVHLAYGLPEPPDQEGDLDSQAITAAKKIMEREYPAWYHKYPDCMADISFLTDYDQFRWNSKTMKDAKKIQKLDARQIVHLLYD